MPKSRSEIILVCCRTTCYWRTRDRRWQLCWNSSTSTGNCRRRSCRRPCCEMPRRQCCRHHWQYSLLMATSVYSSCAYLSVSALAAVRETWCLVYSSQWLPWRFSWLPLGVAFFKICSNLSKPPRNSAFEERNYRLRLLWQLEVKIC